MKKYCMKCMREISKGELCQYCGDISAHEMALHMLKPGSILRERYMVGQTLGQGGFGITYIGRDMLLNCRVAIKEYYPHGYANRNVDSSLAISVTESKYRDVINKGLAKFLDEARNLAEFYDESGIVNVRDYFEENNTAYIVMEYLEGVTLHQFIKNNLFSPDAIVKLFVPVIESLQKMHEKNIIHRDISPDNIMLLANGNIKLMDFGAAKEVDYKDPKSMSIVLKNGFAPVEQYRAKGPIGPWTDVYALASTMYACITGTIPDISLERIYEDEVKWPRELGIPVSQDFENILKKGMSVRYEDRYKTVEEFFRDLQNVVANCEEESAEYGTNTNINRITIDNLNNEIGVLVKTLMTDSLFEESSNTGSKDINEVINTDSGIEENNEYTIVNKNVDVNLDIETPKIAGANPIYRKRIVKVVAVILVLVCAAFVGNRFIVYRKSMIVKYGPDFIRIMEDIQQYYRDENPERKISSMVITNESGYGDDVGAYYSADCVVQFTGDTKEYNYSILYVWNTITEVWDVVYI